MFGDVTSKVLDTLVGLLPLSPFQQFLADFQGFPGLAWLNWFIPVRDILTVLTAWLGALALFYIYSVVLRWVKVIGD